MDLRPQIFPHSVVKQDVGNPSFFWSKIIFDAFKKNSRKGKFWQERKKMYYPHPFWDNMAQDIQTAKLLNSLLEIVN